MGGTEIFVAAGMELAGTGVGTGTDSAGVRLGLSPEFAGIPGFAAKFLPESGSLVKLLQSPLL